MYLLSRFLCFYRFHPGAKRQAVDRTIQDELLSLLATESLFLDPDSNVSVWCDQRTFSNPVRLPDGNAMEYDSEFNCWQNQLATFLYFKDLLRNQLDKSTYNTCCSLNIQLEAIVFTLLFLGLTLLFLVGRGGLHTPDFFKMLKCLAIATSFFTVALSSSKVPTLSSM